MNCSPPGSSVYGILQARILEWVMISSYDLPNPAIEPMSFMSPALAVRVFITGATWEAPRGFTDEGTDLERLRNKGSQRAWDREAL